MLSWAKYLLQPSIEEGSYKEEFSGINSRLSANSYKPPRLAFSVLAHALLSYVSRWTGIRLLSSVLEAKIPT